MTLASALNIHHREYLEKYGEQKPAKVVLEVLQDLTVNSEPNKYFRINDITYRVHDAIYNQKKKLERKGEWDLVYKAYLFVYSNQNVGKILKEKIPEDKLDTIILGDSKIKCYRAKLKKAPIKLKTP